MLFDRLRLNVLNADRSVGYHIVQLKDGLKRVQLWDMYTSLLSLCRSLLR